MKDGYPTLSSSLNLMAQGSLNKTIIVPNVVCLLCPAKCFYGLFKQKETSMTNISAETKHTLIYRLLIMSAAYTSMFKCTPDLFCHATCKPDQTAPPGP